MTFTPKEGKLRLVPIVPFVKDPKSSSSPSLAGTGVSSSAIKILYNWEINPFFQSVCVNKCSIGCLVSKNLFVWA